MVTDGDTAREADMLCKWGVHGDLCMLHLNTHTVSCAEHLAMRSAYSKISYIPRDLCIVEISAAYSRTAVGRR